MNSGLIYTDQSASDLRLSVVGGNIDYAQFHVVGQAFHECSGLLLEARIIGASHVLTFSYAGTTLTEVLACMQIKETDMLYSSYLKDMGDSAEFVFQGESHGLAYSFTSELIDLRMKSQEILDFREDIVSGRRPGLAYEFPSNDNYGVKPMTLIAANSEDDVPCFKVETGHVYPQEGLAVVTATTVGSKIRRENGCISTGCSS